VVDPKKVVGAIRSTSFRITLRAGQTPPHFARAVYGTARNARGTSVNFGFFLTGGANAQDYFEPSLMRLVPGATVQGSTAGESYIAITSAGSAGPSGNPKTEEEFTIADTVQERVAGLARKALEEE
jgi:hypothetical protein